MAKKSQNRILWEKQIKRIKNAMRAVKKEGYQLNYNIPDTPKRITKQAIEELKKVTRNKLRRHANYWLDYETGEYKESIEKVHEQEQERKETATRKRRLTMFKKAREDFFNNKINEDEYKKIFNKYLDTLSPIEAENLQPLYSVDIEIRSERDTVTREYENYREPDTINYSVYEDMANEFLSFLNSFSSIAEGAGYVKNAILNITKDREIIGQAYADTVNDYGDFTFNEAYHLQLATTWLEEFIRHLPADEQNYYDENKELFDSALDDFDNGDEYDI